MLALLVAIFTVMGILSAIHAVMHTRTAQGAIAWSVSLVTFPYVAVPAYWVLGRDKFQGVEAAYLEKADEVDALIDEIVAGLETTVVDTEVPVPEYEALKKLGGYFVRGNRAELLIDGEATFESILTGIAAARGYVLVQFYIIKDDGLGNRIKDALLERLAEGVRVYVIYDEIGSSGLAKTPLVEELEAAGAEVSMFGTRRGRRNRFQLNFRNHRKIVVVDGRTAWIGGHNIGDDYLGLYPDFSPWRDTHARFEGPAALAAQAVFVGDWYWATRELPSLNWEPHPVPDAGAPVMVLPSGPADRFETAALLHLHALNSARERIWIATPYFVPDDSVVAALELAALRGVDIRILLPHKGDSLPVSLAAETFVDRLSKVDGIRFFRHNQGFMHQKVFLVDQKVAAVGTANFDNRSFRLNFEVTALVHDLEFAQAVERMLENDFRNSEPIPQGALGKRSFLHRLAAQTARLAAPVL